MTELVPLKQRANTVRDLLLANKEAIQAALPRHLTVDRLLRIMFTCIATTPKLLDCAPRSLLSAALTCAQLGLEPGPLLGHAYLVPFQNRKAGRTEVQVIPGYKGLLKLARNSRELSTIYAQAVYAKDLFHYQLGTEPKIIHEPSDEADRGQLVKFYAVARLKDGGVQFQVMTRQDVERIRDRYSRAGKAGPWVEEFEAMGEKTVLRKLCKVLPASIELQTAVALDERAEIRLPQELPDVLEEAAQPIGESAGQGQATLDDLAT